MKSVLFVDDDSLVLEGLQDRLVRHRRKWSMKFLLDAEEALAEVQSRPYDVIVSDMRMPRMDGATLLTKVREVRPGMIRIILSGYAEFEAVLRAVPVAHQFLTKPCEVDVLENVIERSCELHRLTSEERVRRIAGRVQSLPTLPRIYSELLQVLADESSGAPEVAALLEQDMAMSAKILQLVNSAFFGLGREISSVTQAVNYLGFNLVKNLVLTAEVFALRGPAVVGGYSLAAAQVHAMDVARRAHRIHADKNGDGFVAAVLHDIGKLVLATGLGAEYEAVRSEARATRRPEHEVERERLGTTHAEVGAYLLGLWGLPDHIVEAVAFHHAADRVQQQGLDPLAAVVIANGLAHQATPDAGGFVHDSLDPDYVERLGLTSRLETWRDPPLEPGEAA